jgi:GNAT superfamily N-acetyltransferase
MGEVTPLTKVSGQPISAPTPYNALLHDVSRFECGKPPLNDWLRDKAVKSEGKSARCYVTCDQNSVIGYYCISTGSIAHAQVTAKLRQNMPDPIPVMILGRLAVDAQYQHQGIGPSLLRDALLRMVQVSGTVGARAVLVHALDQEAVGFYTAHGFRQSPSNQQTLWLPMEEIIANL